MNNFLNKFQPVDVIAIICIIGCFILKSAGLNGTVSSILVTIVAAYFGKTQILDRITTEKISTAKVESVEQTIRRIAVEEGVNSDLAVRVAKCESGLNPMARSDNGNGSIDRGLFQWNNKWHPEISDEQAYNIDYATRAFCKAFKEGHLSWWNASKKCWNI